jgi:uncharacterized protein (DUF1778 family)
MSRQIAVCVKPGERELLVEAAKRAQRSLSDFVRLAALEKIKSDNETDKILHASA